MKRLSNEMGSLRLPSDVVPEPTKDSVLAACEAFDKENGPCEWVLTQLFQKFTENTDFGEVLVKTKVLNTLYNAHVLAVNVLATHICSLEIDPVLKEGGAGIVDTIASVRNPATGKVRQYYSFASKYCSWHKPDSYPIWDSRVRAYLMWLRKRPAGSFLVKSPDNWKCYGEFVEMVNNLRQVYKLGALSFKQIDKFLYTEGEKLIPAKEDHSARLDAATSTQL